MQELKEKGNEFFKRGDHNEAYKLYTQAIQLASTDASVDQSQLHIIYANRAASLLSLERFQEALDDCDKVIELDPKFTKAYLRKALALRGLGQLTKALEVVEAGLEIDKNPKAVAVPELLQVKNSLRGELKKKVTKRSAKETEELVKDYNEVVGEVEQLNYELESRDRALKSMKLTLDYVKQIQQSTGQAPKTYLPVGRMFLSRPTTEIMGQMESSIGEVSQEFSSLQEKMRTNESKLKSLSGELEEIMRANEQ